MRYLPQEPDLTGYANTLAYAEAGIGPGDDPYRARYLLEQLGLTGEEEPHRLSGGEARRAALARVLAPSPDILLLDEPTNHLDLPAIAWLEAELAAMRSALVIISHDRRLLESLSRAIVWLDRGATRRIDRGFAHFEAWRDETLEQEARDQHKLGRKLVMEEDWLRYGVTARRKRNVRRLADLHDAARASASELRGPQGGLEARGGGCGAFGQAGRRRGRGRRRASASASSCATSPPGSCAATASASSGRTAPARPRCSRCSPASSRPMPARCGSAPRWRW